MADEAIARPETVLISGFGLGGAAFALALARQGIRSIILESRNEVSVQGRGRAINLSPNGIRVLDQIGVWDQLQHHGTLFDVMYVVRADGGSLGGLRIGDEKKYGYRASGIWRADVHREMAEALKQTGLATIHYDSRVASITEADSSVTVTLTNGKTVSGDWLVGADGVRSSVRQHMFGDLHGITYDGMTAIDGIVDLSKVELEQHNIPPNAMIFGQEGAGGFFKVEDGATMWSIMVQIPERDRAGWKTFLESGEALETARSRIKGWGSPMETLLNLTENKDCTLWPFYWVPPLDTWHAGRCVLMGDAAHAFPPFAGQGTAQALEDAAVLSRVFAEGGSFATYERERMKRAEGIRTMTKVASEWFRPTMSWLRYQIKMYSLWFTIPYASWRGSEPIYRYDATTVPII